ncbi:VOC family protein [Undibacterium sp. Dicai25W]|uniref:VOC family protein n=1 Tax=Undibacterium sp. Dicai25W TaxID=3413034 RepID=UPI003BF3AA94
MKLISKCILITVMLSASSSSWSQTPESANGAAGHITGVGGIFFKAKDPKALAAWYRDVLGLPVAAWGGAVMRYDAPEHPPAIGWSIFPSSTKYFAPATSEMMINYAVDNMDAVIVRLNAKGVEIIKRSDDDQNGRFAWILDPEGNKIELWEPKLKASK